MNALPSVFAAAACVVLAGTSTSASAAAACPGLLRIVGAPAPAAKRGAEPINLELGDCEVRARQSPALGTYRRTLELAVIGPRAAVLRQKFEPGSPDGAALANAELRIEPAGDRGPSAIPKGPLLESISARWIPNGHWRWHASRAVLRWEGPNVPVMLSAPARTQ